MPSNLEDDDLTVAKNAVQGSVQLFDHVCDVLLDPIGSVDRGARARPGSTAQSVRAGWWLGSKGRPDRSVAG